MVWSASLASSSVALAPGAAKALHGDCTGFCRHGLDHFLEFRADLRCQRPGAQQTARAGEFVERNLDFIDGQFAVAAVAEDAPNSTRAAFFHLGESREHDRVRQ